MTAAAGRTYRRWDAPHPRPKERRHGPSRAGAAARGRPGGLRDHRGPGARDDLPVPVPAGTARPARLPDRRASRSTTGRTSACGATHASASPATGEQIDDDVFARFAARLSYVAGDFADAATYARVADAVGGARQPGLLPRDPAVPVRAGRRGAGRGGPDQVGPGGGGEALRPRPRVRAGARRGAAPVHRRVAAVPDRPLPREDGPRGDPLPALREHDARAGVEPEPRRVRRDHDGGGLRRRGPRALLRPGRRAPGRGGQPPHAGGGRGGDGAAVAR